MDYKAVFQNLAENKESAKYIIDYKVSLKNFLKKVRPEILNLRTKGEIGIYLYDNIFYSDTPLKLSKLELSYLFKVTYQMSPSPSNTKDDLVWKLRRYFDSIIRTADLAKNLWY